MEVFSEKTGSDTGLKGFGELEKGILQGQSCESRSAGGPEVQRWQGPRGWEVGQQERGRWDPSHGLPTKASSLFSAGVRSLRGRGPSLGRSGTLKAGGRGRGVAFLLRKPQSGQRGGLTVMWSGNSALGKDISFPLEIFCDFLKKLLFGKDFI